MRIIGDRSSTAEHQFVELRVAGSSPVGHPRFSALVTKLRLFESICEVWVCT